jgi:hypothetical protein
MIRVTCGQCNATLTVADNLAGKKGRCQKCGALVVVPGIEQSKTQQSVAPKTVGAPLATGSAPSVPSNTTDTAGLTPYPRSSFTDARNSPIVRTVRSLVRLPVAATGLQYGQIPYNARMVRWGAGIVWYWGWGTFLIGLLAVTLGIVVGALALVGGKIEAAAFAWTAISFGVGSVIAGIFGIAVAAFFRLLSYTCEAIRDAIILQSATSALQQGQTSTPVQPGDRAEHEAVNNHRTEQV